MKKHKSLGAAILNIGKKFQADKVNIPKLKRQWAAKQQLLDVWTYVHKHFQMKMK